MLCKGDQVPLTGGRVSRVVTPGNAGKGLATMEHGLRLFDGRLMVGIKGTGIAAIGFRFWQRTLARFRGS